MQFVIAQLEKCCYLEKNLAFYIYDTNVAKLLNRSFLITSHYFKE